MPPAWKLQCSLSSFPALPTSLTCLSLPLLPACLLALPPSPSSCRWRCEKHKGPWYGPAWVWPSVSLKQGIWNDSISLPHSGPSKSSAQCSTAKRCVISRQLKELVSSLNKGDFPKDKFITGSGSSRTRLVFSYLSALEHEELENYSTNCKIPPAATSPCRVVSLCVPGCGNHCHSTEPPPSATAGRPAGFTEVGASSDLPARKVFQSLLISTRNL